MWGTFIGSTVQRQSLKFLWLEECLEGENLYAAGTYSKILSSVAAPVQKGADVRLNHEVSKITATGCEGQPSVSVRCEGKQEEVFDEVIVTVPLGYLKKKHKEMFEPPLPERMSAAIDSLGYGNLEKVYMTFSEAWWDVPDPRSHSNFAEGSKELLREAKEGVPNVTANSHPLHTSSSSSTESGGGERGRKEEHYAGITTFLAPSYAEDTNPKVWIQEAFNLAALPTDCAHPTLMFYISGPTAMHLTSLSPSQLWDFFRPYISRLPNYAANSPKCTPIQILPTTWSKDRFAGYGSYTNFPVGSKDCDGDVLALREGKGCVETGCWIAGEHTASFLALGTVTGAYWAGEAVAQRILGCWGLGKGGKDEGERDKR